MPYTRLLLAVLALVALTGSHSPSHRPNVLVILVDDLRADVLGVAGHPFSQTPNIDRLAAEGLRFTNAFVASPLCSPSRASFYTGQHARNHGIRENNQNGSGSGAGLLTYGALLQRAGYRTAHIGKWHMDFTAAPRFGFDRWVSFMQQGAHVDPLLNIDGAEVASLGYTTDLLTDHAIAFVQEDHGGRPFALTLAYKAVHGPFPVDDSHVPPAFRGLYSDQTITPPPNAQSSYTLAGKPALLNQPPGFKAPIPGVTGLRPGLPQSQLRMLAHIDQNIGRLLQALQAAGHLDDTIIVFTSDSGYFWGEHGLSVKISPYDPGIRVPFIVRLPGLVPQGAVTDQLVSSVDLAPTLLQLASGAIPPTVNGRSLLPVLQDPQQAVRERIFSEYFRLDPAANQNFPAWTLVRDRDWKFIRYPELGPFFDELYDLTSDPHEMVNRIGDATVDSIRVGMQDALKEEVRSAFTRTFDFRVPGSALDYETNDSGTTPQNGHVLIAGSDDRTPPGGRNAVLLFELPRIAPGDFIESARIDLYMYTIDAYHPAPDVHADLWYLGIGDGAPFPAYIEADNDPDPSHVKLSDNAMWWDRRANRISSDPGASEALAAEMMAFYAGNPSYAGGRYLYLRINPDGDTGTTRKGWTLISSQHGDATLRPSLALTLRTDCTDGTDNDLDGLSDFDGGQWIHGACVSGSCPAGVSDIDGDGVADPDPECADSSWVEGSKAGVACGLGPELAMLLPLLQAWRSRRRLRVWLGPTLHPAPAAAALSLAAPDAVQRDLPGGPQAQG